MKGIVGSWLLLWSLDKAKPCKAKSAAGAAEEGLVTRRVPVACYSLTLLYNLGVRDGWEG